LPSRNTPPAYDIIISSALLQIAAFGIAFYAGSAPFSLSVKPSEIDLFRLSMRLLITFGRNKGIYTFTRRRETIF